MLESLPLWWSNPSRAKLKSSKDDGTTKLPKNSNTHLKVDELLTSPAGEFMFFYALSKKEIRCQISSYIL